MNPIRIWLDGFRPFSRLYATAKLGVIGLRSTSVAFGSAATATLTGSLRTQQKFSKYSCFKNMNACNTPPELPRMQLILPVQPAFHEHSIER